MTSKAPFKWRHFPPDVILWGVRWYCLYPLSYRQLSEMMCDRGIVEADHRVVLQLDFMNGRLLGKYVNGRLRYSGDSSPNLDYLDQFAVNPPSTTRGCPVM